MEKKQTLRRARGRRKNFFLRRLGLTPTQSDLNLGEESRFGEFERRGLRGKVDSGGHQNLEIGGDVCLEINGASSKVGG